MANNNEQKSALNVNEHLSKSESFFIKNKKVLIYGVIAVIVLVAGWFLYKQYVQAPKEAEASTKLAKGQEYFNQEMFDKALNGDGAGFTGFKGIISDYSGTDAENLANLYAGLCCVNTGKYQEAVNYLESYSASDDEMISPAAEAALGNAYVYIKQYDKAVDALKKAASMADSEAEDGVNNSISPRCLIQAGEILENQGKKDEALKIYQDIKKKYLNSPVRQEIDKYIERATK
ncbi:MAG: tetratricopeptide repeat protein [Prevotella sp.]|nr:tetratricopeptide repeat protein [Prevotella sp.]MDD7046755.1 tetratricopeptide repeat protein [Prevotella sp.]MDY5547262.1 tetratricopeptide repeat protein [Prevotella sp.]